MTKQQIKERLAYLRQEIEQERISYGEIAELQSLAKYIDKNDVLLLEWAGVPELGCDNTDCKNPDNPDDIRQVEMRPEFEGGLFNWCSDCRNRDRDMINQ